MQVEQVGDAKFVNAVMGNSQAKPFYRVTVADSNNEILTFYTDANIYARLAAAVFGDDVHLVFQLAQWKTGLNVRIVDLVLKKNS